MSRHRMTDSSHPRRKLGWLPSDPRMPRMTMASVVNSSAVPVPDSVNYLDVITDWDMGLNDKLGSCTAAAFDHLFRVWTKYGQGTEAEFTDNDVLKFYEGSTGYNPINPSSDRGGVMTDVLSYARKTGMAGHKIAAYLKVDPINSAEIKTALYLFGGLYVGMNFPRSAMHQFDTGEVWHVAGDSTIEGGHCVHLGAIDASGMWQIVTWGRTAYVSQEFVDAYVVEIEAPVSVEWVRGDESGGHVDVVTLNAEFTRLTGQPGPFPVLPAVQPPTPPAPPVPVPPVVQPPPAPPLPLTNETARFLIDIQRRSAAIHDMIASYLNQHRRS
jgi:hypothetical protein